MLEHYFAVMVFLVIGIVIGSAPLIIARIVAPHNPYKAKLSPYECGFDALEDARIPFDVRFYLVAILFIIFDLETAFLFPWAAAFRQIGPLAFWSMLIFLGILVVGFIYEWKKGALEWE